MHGRQGDSFVFWSVDVMKDPKVVMWYIVLINGHAVCQMLVAFAQQCSD